ncbi:hypothetical protein P7C73_g2905, partial [Tremellales sp. Uapishka_1]
MSLSLLRLRAPLSRSVRPIASSTRAMSSHVHGGDPDVIAHEKAKNLSGTQDSSAPHKDHAPGWNETLASDSEASIKADQAAPGTGGPTKEMQDSTVKHTHDKHHNVDETDRTHKIHNAKGNAEMTGSEDAVKADRGEH